jgi:hypothetical protein
VLRGLPAWADEPGQIPAQRLAEVNQAVDALLARVATIDTRDPGKRDRQVAELRRDVDAFVLRSWKTLESLKANDAPNPEDLARVTSKLDLAREATATPPRTGRRARRVARLQVRRERSHQHLLAEDPQSLPLSR